LEFVKKIDIYYSGYIQTHCQKNKKIKRVDQILPEVYGTTLNTFYVGKQFLQTTKIADILV
jgi:hypothetical protein